MSVGKYEDVGDDEAGPGDTWNVSESTDSDEMHNADGDEPVEPPQKWSASGKFGLVANEASEGESLDKKLWAERPDVDRETAEDPAPDE
ncbi:hypothetical protein ABFW00_03900 [Mycobacteroides abscessus]|uniref:hypothetical protein n=1 Tax=Mycobacteroides abscessus TaxID=36809 RepID=UPI0034CE54EE